jgi:hypothetical protein
VDDCKVQRKGVLDVYDRVYYGKGLCEVGYLQFEEYGCD